jgi:HK97 family phage prohead protease
MNEPITCPKCGEKIYLFESPRAKAPRVTETRSAAASTRERRSIAVTNLRVKREDGKPTQIAGHAAVFDQLSRTLTTRKGVKFREKISPGAFKRSINQCSQPGSEIMALRDHDPEKILCRTDTGTLKLSEDETGLAFEMTLPDTQLARDCIADVDHGNIKGMSFGFGEPTDSWQQVDGENIRTLSDIPVGEITLTPYPAYDGTDVNTRSIEAAVAKLENRAIVQYDDQTIQYVADHAYRACQEAFTAVRCLIRFIENNTGEPTPADCSAVADALDQAIDLSDKIECLQACADGLCAPDAGGGTAGDGRDDLAGGDADGNTIGDYSDTDDDGSESRRLREQIQQTANAGQSTLELRNRLAEVCKRDAKRQSEKAKKQNRRDKIKNLRAGHMTHADSKPSLNKKAVDHATSMINDGKIDDGEWSFSADDQATLLGKDDWDQYALWFLAFDKNADAKSNDAYKYPFGKDGKVYTRALKAIRTQAGKQGASAVNDAAGDLLKAIADKEKK